MTEETKNSELSDEQKQRRLPEPVRYYLLCATIEIDEKYESGLLKANQSQHYDQLLSPVMFVMKMGPDAYSDETRFPSGPSCKVGQFVVVRPNTGTRLMIDGKEFRIISDDCVEGVIDDPRGVSRI